jgi:hypothetical protein
VCIGCIWLRKGTSGRLLRTRQWTFVFYKRRRIQKDSDPWWRCCVWQPVTLFFVATVFSYLSSPTYQLLSTVWKWQKCLQLSQGVGFHLFSAVHWVIDELWGHKIFFSSIPTGNKFHSQFPLSPQWSGYWYSFPFGMWAHSNRCSVTLGTQHHEPFIIKDNSNSRETATEVEMV